jgi:hypothetical protein
MQLTLSCQSGLFDWSREISMRTLSGSFPSATSAAAQDAEVVAEDSVDPQELLHEVLSGGLGLCNVFRHFALKISPLSAAHLPEAIRSAQCRAIA